MKIMQKNLRKNKIPLLNFTHLQTITATMSIITTYEEMNNE